MSGEATVVLRPSRREDAPAIRRVAERDCAPPPGGAALIGEVEGEVRACLELASGRVAADSFHPTAELVEMLRVRARRVRATEEGGSGPARVVFRRLRRAAVATSG